MKVLTITSCAILIWLCPRDVTSDFSSKFLGIGYNLLTGNPDGGPSEKGGVDPGLLYTRKIFDLSNPLTIQAENRRRCSEVSQVSVFYGAKSYQEKLQSSVSIGGGAHLGIASFAFGLSTSFEQASQQTTNEHKVFQDHQTTCNLGRQRFAEELAEAYSFPVTQNFAASICSLPSSYDVVEYMQFLDEWGTHVTMEIELGTKNITRYKSTLTSFVEHVSHTSSQDVSAGGSFLGFRSSLKVDFGNFKRRYNFGRTFGSYLTTLRIGTTTSLPEPIGLKIQPIYVALSPEYWSNTSLLTSNNVCTTSELSSIVAVRLNLRKAVSEYATYKLALIPTDPDLQIPLAWPRGTYGLYEANTGCPEGRATWYQGWRYHDTEDHDNNNRFSNPLHLRGSFDKNIMTSFCIKGNYESSAFDLDWPKGDYCIAKYGYCPTGFHEGWIFWDDENSDNRNKRDGYLPDGDYNEDTKIYYCCRDDGLPTMAIYLPNDKPFYLLRHTRLCQRVHGMHVREEFIRWDAEDYNKFLFPGVLLAKPKTSSNYHPLDKEGKNNHRLHFCYYTRADY